MISTTNTLRNDTSHNNTLRNNTIYTSLDDIILPVYKPLHILTTEMAPISVVSSATSSSATTATTLHRPYHPFKPQPVEIDNSIYNYSYKTNTKSTTTSSATATTSSATATTSSATAAATTHSSPVLVDDAENTLQTHLNNLLAAYNPSRIYLRGGRYSGKSTEVARYIVLGLLFDQNKSAICFRRYGNTLQGSVYTELINAMYDLGVDHLFTTLKNPLRIIRRVPKSPSNPKGYGDQVIYFQHLSQPDDYRKIKSIKLVRSYFAYIWFEEADEFLDQKSITQVLLSLFRNGTDFKVFYTFNTPFSSSHYLNTEWGSHPHITKVPQFYTSPVLLRPEASQHHNSLALSQMPLPYPDPTHPASPGYKYYYQHTSIYDLPHRYNTR